MPDIRPQLVLVQGAHPVVGFLSHSPRLLSAVLTCAHLPAACLAHSALGHHCVSNTFSHQNQMSDRTWEKAQVSERFQCVMVGKAWQ